VVVTLPPSTAHEENAPSGAYPDWIYLEKAAFPCAVGVFQWEQDRAQTLEVHIGLNLNLDAAAGGDLAASVDYAACLAQVQFIAQNRRWRLLESLALALARHLLSPPGATEPRVQVENVVVRLRKPDVFEGRAVPCIEVRRNRAWWSSLHGETRPGARTPALLSVLHESADAGAYQVEIASGAKWTLPDSGVAQVLCGQLQSGESVVRRGEVIGKGGHVLHNSGESAARLLVVVEPLVQGASVVR
jgi:dihydroneopterin aldolase